MKEKLVKSRNKKPKISYGLKTTPNKIKNDRAFGCNIFSKICNKD